MIAHARAGNRERALGRKPVAKAAGLKKQFLTSIDPDVIRAIKAVALATDKPRPKSWKRPPGNGSNGITQTRLRADAGVESRPLLERWFPLDCLNDRLVELIWSAGNGRPGLMRRLSQKVINRSAWTLSEAKLALHLDWGERTLGYLDALFAGRFEEAQGLLVQISSEPAVAPGYILAGLSVLHRGDTSGASMKVSCSLSFNRACSDLTSRNSGFRNLSSADRAPREDMK